MEIEIYLGSIDCEKLMAAIGPDNDDTIMMECVDRHLKIEIRDLKITSAYNVVDDLIRSYEVFKKLIDEQ